MFKSIPNILTLLRICLIPVFVVIFYLPFASAHVVAALIFAFACITDWWDGYLARKLDQTTKFGAFLDPVADKLIVVTALVMVVGVNYLHGLVLPAVVIIGREIVVSALREWMAEIGQRAHVAVVTIAKWKTLLQMCAIFCLVAYTPGFYRIFLVVGYITVYAAMFLTLWTMILYLYAARQAFADNV
jgi:CDP-diacylglycerol--glycerol-3-phosphate 3-phosphatidyltransferase